MASWLKWTARRAPLIISSVSLVLMMMVIVVHVIGRNLFSSPLYGGVEIISLSGVFLISFALGYTQLQKGHIAVEVEDAYRACEEVKKRGGKVTREAGPMKHGTTVIAFVEDPDGYKIELIEKPS